MPQVEENRHTVRRRAATAMIAEALVRDVACTLAAVGVPVMPLKGVLFQHWLYDEASDRHLTDVDVLVQPRHVTTAHEALARAGYRPFDHSVSGAVAFSTPFALALDLHEGLFDSARYHMPTDALFARSRGDREMFGVEVRLPSTVDVYAHLIGKFASDHRAARDRTAIDEIQRVGAHIELTASRVASHLTSCGVARAARYALPVIHAETGDALAHEVWRCLPRDPMGEGVAALAHAVLPRLSPEARAGAVVAHLLNASIARGFWSGGRALVRRRALGR